MSTENFTVCDWCAQVIPFNSRNIVVAKFRIGAGEKHDFTVHQTCIMPYLEHVCSDELPFLGVGPFAKAG